MYRNDDRRGQYADDQRWGGVSYGRGDQMNPDRMWQGDNPRDRDYGMVGSWRERRDDWRNEGFDDASRYGHVRRWDIDDRFNDDRGRRLQQAWDRFEQRDRWDDQDRWSQRDLWQHQGRQGLWQNQGQWQQNPWQNPWQQSSWQQGSWPHNPWQQNQWQQGSWQQNQWQQGPHSGKGPRGYQRNFERVKENICDALERDSFLDASNIEIRVENGEVTLTGTVNDRMQKRRAEMLAEQIDGVKDVHNQIRVSPSKTETVSPNPTNTQASGRSART